ncbi:hypothetical protein IQ272_05915 [Chroococcidiopsidales cyanobacterium LEGE 13417]|uniref:hypothetical protein n=1 Tax=Chroococcidiopsis sp. CCALA 051 TaxID=869949 RepID=UPI0011B1F258|nr:hypothetical protein [Chroococcidiopsis sp. CCALA 051]MBE9015686.1 hypothetical protein [Chroococcidiopsidales cyanobacterium LEGE 13417]
MFVCLVHDRIHARRDRSQNNRCYFFSKPTDSKAAEALLMTQPDWEQDLQAMAQSVQGKRSKPVKP